MTEFRTARATLMRCGYSALATHALDVAIKLELADGPVR